MNTEDLRRGAFNTRPCAMCEEPIYECMGYVKIGDLLEGRRPIRELCGKCVFLWEWTAEGMLTPSTEVFLLNLYHLDSTDRDRCTDLIFQTIDKLLCDDNFERVDKILREVDVSQLTTHAMRSLLCITHTAKYRLPEWYAFYLRVRKHMIPLKGRRITEKLIGGFLD